MHQRYHLALRAPLTLSRIHSEGSELKALKSALRKQTFITHLRVGDDLTPLTPLGPDGEYRSAPQERYLCH